MSTRIPSLNWLRVFEAAARHESFARAAIELNMSPAAVSQQVRALEERLGAPLFHRKAHSVHLTDTGRAYLPPVMQSLLTLGSATDGLFGKVRERQLYVQSVLIFAHGILARGLSDFSVKHPGVVLTLTTGNAVTDFQHGFQDLQIIFGNPETYGRILNTPKPGWAQSDLAGPLRESLGVPIHFDTDVNAAALGEGTWGAAIGLHTFSYLTVGTGIGGGAIIDGRILHGSLHPEIGHLRVPHDLDRDPFAGCCPFHGDCLEGLASGPAIAERWGRDARELPPEHEAWPLQAHYLGLALANLSLTLSPQMIILGGGVMEQAHLFPMVREELDQLLNGYLNPPDIVPPALGNRAGILGSLALAQG